MTYKRYHEYLRDCEAPDEAELERLLEEGLRTLEFCVMMEVMCNGLPAKES